MAVVVLASCSRPAPRSAGKVVSDGHQAQNVHACQVFWHPMRTRLPQRCAIAEFANAEVGKTRELRGNWENRRAQVRWTLLKSADGQDHYRFEISTSQEEGGQEVSKEIVMAGEPVVVFESRYHRVSIAPLKTPPVELIDFGAMPALVQQPELLNDEAAILVYYHGAGHNEWQGARLFPYMRELLAEKGWILVSPRTYEFIELRKALVATFGERRIYLAGASAGCSFSYRMAVEGAKIDGLFLIGAALTDRSPAPTPSWQKPTYLIFGDQDGALTTGARRIGKALEAAGVPKLSREIPGGGHDAAHFDLSWWSEALGFVTGEEFGTEPVPVLP